jgi:predicted metal-dependent hydrolase
MSIIPYKVIRSNRKTIALIIDNSANLVIRAPTKIRDNEIKNFIEKKKHWIADKQHKVSTFAEKHSPVLIKTGEGLMYLGDTYTIIIDNVPDIQFSNTHILVPDGYCREDVIKWLKKEANTILAERLVSYASLIGVQYSAFKLSEAKARWGSCSSKGNLNFAWRLIMCPITVIDYVVVHELSHITYKNHSSGFWARVKTVLPNYKEQQNWLKANQRLMEVI